MTLKIGFLQKKEVKEYFLVLCVEEHRISAAVAKIIEDKLTIIGTGESQWSLLENETEAADIALSTAEKELSPDILIEKVIFGLPINFLEKEKVKPEYKERLKNICNNLSLSSIGFIEFPQALSIYYEKKEESPPTTIFLFIGNENLTFSLVRVGKIENNFDFKRTTSLIGDFEEALRSFAQEILPSRIIIYDETGSLNTEEVIEELLSYPWNKNASFLHTPRIEVLPKAHILTAIVEAAGGNILKELYIEEVKTEKKGQEDFFGFVKNKDIKQEMQTGYKEELDKSIPQKREEDLQHLPNKATIVDRLSTFIKKIIPTKPSLSFPTTSSISIIIGTIFLLLGCTVVLGSLIWFYPKALVNLIVYPTVLTKHIDLNLTTNSEKLKSLKNGILVKKVSEEISGDKTMNTTGKNRIGDAAKGEVTIYNKTSISKTFPKGTILTNGTLKFTLDSEILIASASDTGEGVTFGKTAAKLTSSDIGPEGNLQPGSIFLFKDLPESLFLAKNTQNFTGGSSRDISSVSKEDQDRLITSLTQELLSNIKPKLLSKIGSTEGMVDNSIEQEILSKKFSKEIGAESKDLSLTLNMKASYLVYQIEDFTNLIQETVPQEQDNALLDKTRTKIFIEKMEKSPKGEITAVTKITLYYLPIIDQEKIKKDLAGKSYDNARNYLSNLKKIGGLEIKAEKNIFFLNNNLPFKDSNISVQVISN